MALSLGRQRDHTFTIPRKRKYGCIIKGPKSTFVSFKHNSVSLVSLAFITLQCSALEAIIGTLPLPPDVGIRWWVHLGAGGKKRRRKKRKWISFDLQKVNSSLWLVNGNRTGEWVSDSARFASSHSRVFFGRKFCGPIIK